MKYLSCSFLLFSSYIVLLLLLLLLLLGCFLEFQLSVLLVCGFLVGVPPLGVVGSWFVLLEFQLWVLLVCGLFCWSSRFGCCWFVVCLLEFEIWVLLVCEPPTPPPHDQVREFFSFPFWVCGDDSLSRSF